MARVVSVVLCLALLAGSGLLPSAAADEPTPVETLLVSIEAFRKSKDHTGWSTALKQIKALYPRAEEQERRKLLTALGTGLKAKVLSVQQAALAVLVELDDADPSWKYALKRAIPDEKAEVPGPLDVDYLRALYALHPDGAIDTLLFLMKKAKSPVLAAGALRVLGAYELSKRRVEVLEELVKILIANAPGRSRKGSRGSDRFLAMATQIAAALNDLTGQTFGLKQWGPIWKEHKKQPQKLFVRPLPKEK